MMSTLTTTRPSTLKAPETEFDRFVYTVSHDLQEPLRLIGSFAKLLNTKCADTLDDDSKKYLEYINENTDRLKSMIYALVDYSRAERNQEPIEPINLEELITDLLTMYSTDIEQSNAQITVGDLPIIEGQPSLIINLLKHLFQNAFEAVGKTPLKISFTCEDAGDQWQFCLEDNGTGMRIVPIERAFEMFRKLDRPDENLGAGLAISNAIVKKHGGKMFAETVPNQGTKMYFTLSKKSHGLPED